MTLRRLLFETFFALLLTCVCVGLLLIFDTPPTTQDLDNDLAQIRIQIDASVSDGEKFSGGLIKSIVDLRREILKISETMLIQKRAAVLRRVDLRYNVEGKKLSDATDEELKKVESDLEIAKAKLAKSEKEAARYSGGLLQVLALTSVELDKLSISQLTLSLVSMKYGIAFPIKFQLPNKPQELGPPGAIFPDKGTL
jgi:hypothetical protein